jgi:hypothetical protein
VTTTAPTAAAVSTTSQGSRRGPIRTVIAGSLLTGTVLAAVLPLLVLGELGAHRACSRRHHAGLRL